MTMLHLTCRLGCIALLSCPLWAGPAAAGDAACASGKELHGGLCYKPCESGHTAAVTMCVPDCPTGYRNDGLYCAKPAAYARGAGYPWKLGDTAGSLDDARERCTNDHPEGCEKNGAIIYPVCRSTFKAAGSNICSPICPTGYTDIGVSCQKKTYDRGAGTIPTSLKGKCNITYSSTFADGQARRYDQMTWLTQHNAYASSDHGWSYAMSSFDIKTQLNGGVRALMLDAHTYDGKVMLCHGSCTGGAGVGYALPRKTLSDALKVVKTFLEENTDQVVTVILESYIKSSTDIDKEISDAGLSSYVYDPDDDADWKVSQKGAWPTVNWMVQNNRRFVLLSQESSDAASGTVGAAFAWTYARQNTWDLGGGGKDLSCTSGHASYPITGKYMFVMNHFRAFPSLNGAGVDNKEDKIVDRFKDKCLSVKSPPVFLAVNFYHHEYCSAADAAIALNELWEDFKY